MPYDRLATTLHGPHARTAAVLLAAAALAGCEPSATSTGYGPTGPGADVSGGADATVATCDHDCAPGEAYCLGDAIVTCGQSDADPCLDWGTPAVCPTGETCSLGACSASCQDECVEGAPPVCGLGGWRACGQLDSDPCLDLGPPTPCPTGQACVDGVCVCMDECGPAGLTACTGTAVRTCADLDGDGCLEWTAPTACPADAPCSGGVCTEPCEDGCPEAGATTCEAGGLRTCADLDVDGCVEWGPPEACPAGQTCDGGACVALPCPDADCEALWEQTCSGSGGFKVCGVDPTSGCPRLSHFVGCQAGNSCSAGQCKGACTVPEMIIALDRSSSMEGASWEAVSEAVATFADAFEEQARLGFRAFPGGSGCEPGDIILPALDNGAVIEGALQAPATASSTPVAASLTDLAGVFGDPNQSEGVIVITDGSETCGDAADAVAAVVALRSRGTRVWAVGVGSAYDEVLLGEMAAAGGTGEARSAKSAEALTSVLVGVIAELGGCCADKDGDGHGLGCAKGPDCDDDDGEVMTKDCAGKVCGDDSCGGVCGTCGLVDGAKLVCFDGACLLPPVLINEVAYDGPSADNAHVFVELWGPAGLDLEGLTLVGINGNGGKGYGTVSLAGAVGSDGLFVVAHPEGKAELTAVADQLDAKVDYQNGPDSLELRAGSAVIDAVGYGTFGAEDVFAGEGSPATGVPANSDQSIARIPSGTDTDDNAADFQVRTPTPGAAN